MFDAADAADAIRYEAELALALAGEADETAPETPAPAVSVRVERAGQVPVLIIRHGDAPRPIGDPYAAGVTEPLPRLRRAPR